jgi:transcription initiation factor TFIIE subunit alpha
MRLTQKKVEEIILGITGEEGIALVDQLFGKENISEFELADKTKKDIKVIRRLLYLLYNHNLVGFIRKKDKEKGWYVYYWTLLPECIKFAYYKKRKELLVKLKIRLEEENKELFYICPNDCVRLNFDQGMDFEFHCPECGELIHQDESSEEKVEFLIKKIAEIEEELEKAKKKEYKIRAKQRKKIVKEKVKEVKKKVVKKKLVKKKIVKKVVKKKPIKKKVTPKKAVKKKSVKKIMKKKVIKKKTIKK